MTRSSSYELVVLGGGPGGYAAAFLAADLGMRVAIVEREKNPGGVCLYRGCIPSKALLHVAKLLHETNEAENMGVHFGKPKLDIDRMRAWKESVVERQTGGLGQLVKARNVAFIRGTGRLSAPHTIEVELTDGDREMVTCERAIIATGSRPATVPAFDIGSARILDSTSALALEDVPRKVVEFSGHRVALPIGAVSWGRTQQRVRPGLPAVDADRDADSR